MINIQKIKSHHKKFLSAHDSMVAEAVDEKKLTDLAQRYVNDNSGLKMRTGNLRRRTKVKSFVRTKSGATVRVSNNAKYAWAQDQGSGLYGRKRAKYMIPGNPFLRFVWKGQLMFRRYVMHPGVRQTRFLYNTTDALGRQTAHFIRAKMATVARNF